MKVADLSEWGTEDMHGLLRVSSLWNLESHSRDGYVLTEVIDHTGRLIASELPISVMIPESNIFIVHLNNCPILYSSLPSMVK